MIAKEARAGICSHSGYDLGELGSPETRIEGVPMQIRTILATALVPLVLAACGPNGPNKQDSGMVLGAVAGGVELLGKVGEDARGDRIQTMALGHDPIIERLHADREIIQERRPRNIQAALALRRVRRCRPCDELQRIDVIRLDRERQRLIVDGQKGGTGGSEIAPQSQSGLAQTLPRLRFNPVAPQQIRQCRAPDRTARIHRQIGQQREAFLAGDAHGTAGMTGEQPCRSQQLEPDPAERSRFEHWGGVGLQRQ